MTLMNACYYGILKTVTQILDTGKAKVDEIDEESGHTPLILAARFGHLKIIQLLLKHGADIGKKGFGGLTMLHAACRGDHREAVEWLCGPECTPRAPLDLEDDSGNTPVNEAARMGNLKCMEAVIDAGGKLDTANKAGVTPFLAAVLNCRGAIVDILAKKSIDLNKADNNGNTALHIAASCGYPKIVKQLLTFNLNAAAVNNNGLKAEDVAVNDAIKTMISAYQ